MSLHRLNIATVVAQHKDTFNPISDKRVYPHHNQSENEPRLSIKHAMVSTHLLHSLETRFSLEIAMQNQNVTKDIVMQMWHEMHLF